MSIDNSNPLGMPLNTNTRPAIWTRSPEEVANWSSTLSRVTSIYCHLPLTIYHRETKEGLAPHKKTYPNQELAAAAHQRTLQEWDSAHTHLTDQTYSQDQLTPRLNEALAKLPKQYQADFSRIQGDTAMRINKLSKDFFSAMNLSIKESFLGNEGVLLLRHSRVGLDPITHWTEESVIKWTDPLEVASGDILRIFLHDIYVQEASSLDFSQKSHIKSTSKEALPEELNRVIQSDLRSVRKNFTKKVAETNNIMLAERVPGADLADFVANRWGDLSLEHKMAIFKGIGKIALADLIMGNTDRFTAFKSDSEELINKNHDDEDSEDTECFAANIGNLMIRESNDSSPILCAIDNGVQTENLLGGSEYQKYNQNLDTLLKTNWIENVANAVQTSISNSFAEDSFYFDEKKLSIEEKARLALILPSFIQEVKSISAHEALLQGLREAKVSLDLTFKTEEFNNSLENIETRYAKPTGKPNQISKLCAAVKARIQIFTNNP